MGVRLPVLAIALAVMLISGRSAAQDAPGAPPTLAPDAHVDITTTPPEGSVGALGGGDTTLPAPPPEAPPPRPRKKGVVLESTLGALGFTGQFRHVAPPAVWLHTQLGYEFLNWLMVFGEAELAYTDTSESQDASHVIAFPMWGFGGGVRGTIHATDRVAFFLQGDIGALTAYVPHNALSVLGFRGAEKLDLDVGGRLGAEWYMVDRHMALTAQGGLRDAQGFSKFAGGSDTPLMWDAAAGLRYTF